MQSSEQQTKAPCAGIIVFNGDSTIIVTTKYGNHSFPKGKRHKREDELQCAWRELEEETGLTKKNVEIITDEIIDEFSSKDNLCIRYFIGNLIEEKELSFDPKELKEIRWMKVHDVLMMEKLKEQRKRVLSISFSIYKKEMENRT